MNVLNCWDKLIDLMAPIDMFELVTGYEATDTVHIVNGESEPMQFTFIETSCHAAGYTVNLTVEPMHGTVPANSRFMSYEFIT